VVDEYTRECLAIVVARRIRSHEVLMTLSGLFLGYGVPGHIRSDNGPEFVARAVRDRLAGLGSRPCSSNPPHPGRAATSSLWNGKLRDELLNGEIFSTPKEAQILVAGWRRLCNGLRPHSPPGNRPPAPETIVFPGFSLADFAPPKPVPAVALGLT
jgi:transposase InsO family protein